MSDNGVIAIARKEFFDYIRSQRFLLILGILLVISIIGTLNGISDYKSSVTTYNNLQKTVSHDSGNSADLYITVKPSILQVFFQMSSLFIVIGGILGIAMGFDLVTKEKESKSLKILLAHPVYRDQVINGKALGGIAAILLALGIIMAVSLAILLIFGIVPEVSELLPIMVYCLATFMFIFSFFTIALFMSTICEESGRALVYTLIVFVAFGSFIPAMVTSPLIMDQVIGPMPELPKIVADPAMKDQNRDAVDQYNQQTIEYGEKKIKVADIQYIFSPTHNYGKITAFLTSPETVNNILYPTIGKSPVASLNDTSQDFSVSVAYQKRADLDFSVIFAMIFGNIIALLIQPIVFFGLAYVSFMRMDIR